MTLIYKRITDIKNSNRCIDECWPDHKEKKEIKPVSNRQMHNEIVELENHAKVINKNRYKK